MNTDTHEFSSVTNALATDGWCVVPDLLPAAQTQALAAECRAMHEARQLTPARVGATRTATPLRGDSTHWFQAGSMSVPQQAFADRLGARSIAELRSMSADDIQLKLPDVRLDRPWPIIDRRVIPDDLYALFSRREQHDVPLLTGSNADEGATRAPLAGWPAT